MAVSEEECSNAKSRAQSSTSSSSSSSAAGASNRDHRYLAKCVLRGSAVLHVVYGHIRSASSLDVVFGKETSIELVVIGEDGILQSVCDQPLFGTIKDLAVVPRARRNFHTQTPVGNDLLAVISDSGKLTLLTFSNEMRRFFPLTHVQLSNPGNSRHQPGRMIAVDSSGCFIATSGYEAQLAMFSLSSSFGSDIIDKRIFYPPENEENATVVRSVQRSSISGTIWSMCFISSDSSHPSKEQTPVLAILLNRRGSLLNELLLLRWNIKEHAISVVSQFVEAGPLAHDIVEVPHSSGFAFLFRVGDALLMDLRDANSPCCVYRTSLNFLPAAMEEPNFVDESCKVHDVDDDGLFNVAACALLELRDYDPMCIDGECGIEKSMSKHICSWSWEPESDTNPRMIFCVDTGEFFMIEISFGSEDLKVNLSDCIYKGQPCKALLWVEGGFLAALVEMGDGIVLKVENERLQYLSPIQNVAPILDMSVVDVHDEKHDQMFACCGVAPEGSLRIIRSGISVEKLLRTAPIYQGVTGTWTVRMKENDLYHSFLVLSFVEETRVLSVGLSFTDVTDSVGFQPDVCTLACGLISDGLLVQIHQSAVRLCLPTKVAHAEGIPMSSPICTSWFPDNSSISLGAVGPNLIVVSTSNPCFLYILGVRLLASYRYEIFEMQHIRLLNELSCISIPQTKFKQKQSSSISIVGEDRTAALPIGVDIGNTFIIGTHKPSVEVLSFVPEEGLRVLASGAISFTNTMGNVISGCIPQDVRFVVVDRPYVLTGLRNGLLLRFEWPHTSSLSSPELPSYGFHFGASAVNFKSGVSYTAAVSLQPAVCTADFMDKQMDGLPANLQLIATRRIGITPVFLVPLNDSLDADMIALSDRPWFLQAARHSLSYISISFQPSTHATPVCSAECPKGILFVSENSLHLVEMVHSRRLNVQKFHLGGTPRKVIYHNESKLLLVMRTELSNDTCSSDICCVDPLSGSIVSSYKLELGETGKSMELVKVGSEQVLVVGTSLSSGPAIMPSGEAESSKGRLVILCLEHLQNSDSGSMIFCSKAGPSCQRTTPFREIVGYATEQLSSSSPCSSPDDTCCDGVKLEETEAWQLRYAHAVNWNGMVLAICPYLDRYFVVAAGNSFFVCGFLSDNPQRMKRFAVGKTRYMITSLTAHSTRIAVGDCRDGILFYSYNEDTRKLEQLYCDPSQRLVADCVLIDVDTAMVSDRKGSVAVLSCSDRLECNFNSGNASPECNLTLSGAYNLGEIAMSIKKGSFAYKLSADDMLAACDGLVSNKKASDDTIVAATLLGSVVVFISLSREEHELLEAVQGRLVVHPLTAPILGNDHNEFRSRENPVGVPKILDGDILAQFLELTSAQQEAVLSLSLSSSDIIKMGLKPPPSSYPLPVSQVVKLLERVHHALS